MWTESQLIFLHSPCSLVFVRIFHQTQRNRSAEPVSTTLWAFPSPSQCPVFLPCTMMSSIKALNSPSLGLLMLSFSALFLQQHQYQRTIFFLSTLSLPKTGTPQIFLTNIEQPLCGLLPMSWSINTNLYSLQNLCSPLKMCKQTYS